MRWGWMTLGVLIVAAGCTQPIVKQGESMPTAGEGHAAVTLTVDNFEKEVLESSQPVLVDFWATWCGPCKAIAPMVEEVAQEYAGRAKVGKVDIDHNEAIAMKYKIEVIPVLILFKDGVEVDRLVGVPRGDAKGAIADLVQKAL